MSGLFAGSTLDLRLRAAAFVACRRSPAGWLASVESMGVEGKAEFGKGGEACGSSRSTYRTGWTDRSVWMPSSVM
jgi:hypothetical protein